MPTCAVAPDVTIHYWDHNPRGEPPVLLLHGLGSCGADWAAQVGPLATAGYRVLAPDMPGFGASPYAGGGWTVPGMAQAAAGLLEALGAPPAHVVGISMGGTIALQLALDRPDLVRRLVLVNTFARIPITAKSVGYFLLRGLVLATFGLPAQARLATRRMFPRPEQAALREQLYRRILASDPAAYRAATRALTRFNVLERLGEIRVPTLVVTGAADTTVPPAGQARLAQRIPCARQVVIEGGGHAVIADRADAFNRVLLAFMAEEGAGREVSS